MSHGRWPEFRRPLVEVTYWWNSLSPKLARPVAGDEEGPPYYLFVFFFAFFTITCPFNWDEKLVLVHFSKFGPDMWVPLVKNFVNSR
jgi:hypothetical protein